MSGAGGVTFANIIGSSAGTYTFAAGQFLPTGPLNLSGGTVTINDPITPSSLGPITGTVAQPSGELHLTCHGEPVWPATFIKQEPTDLTVYGGVASFATVEFHFSPVQ